MQYVVGVDEAGRGPLAGPVAVGAVAVAEGFSVVQEFPGVADSKTLSEKKREAIFVLLEAHVALGDARFAVGLSDAAYIDRKGIVLAVRRALAEALARVVPDCSGNVGFTKPNIQALAQAAPDPAQVRVLLDGSLSAPPEYTMQKTIIGGDATEPIISLASIAAKVTRDRLMRAFAAEYPVYGFEKHKGYGTAFHRSAITEHGPCAIHRRTFLH